MTLEQLWTNCLPILPEIILSAAICVIVLLDMLAPIGRSRFVCGMAALVGTLGALWFLMDPTEAVKAARATTSFGGMIANDGLSTFFRMLFLVGSAVTVMFAMASAETVHYRQGEFLALILGATLGACLLVASDNFLMFFLSLETLSLCSYVLAAFVKHQRLSAEAGLKYLLYGAVASGVMVFGISYLYGMTGTIRIPHAVGAMMAQAAQPGFGVAPFLLALVLILAGLGFKMAMVPFQSWAPDVYQGAPTPVTAFLSVVSKGAGFGALLRFMLPLFGQDVMLGSTLDGLIQAAQLPVLFAILAVATMTFGNLVALRQTDVKRLLAYSSIAHAGYLLMGLTVYTAESVQAMMLYFFMYLVMNLGAFWIVIVVVNRVGGSDLAHFKGLWNRAPILAVSMFVFLISLTGMPPTAGFVAKLILFKVVVGAGVGSMAGAAMTPAAWFYFILALIGVVNSVISLFYYMKIMRAMAFDRAEDVAPLGLSIVEGGYAVAFAVATVALLNFGPILKLVNVL
ncbi:MAG: NADH-quinone oxidoreductase subunit N [Candidatus Sumerlaeia bacterium]